jgi:hypothetical protein
MWRRTQMIYIVGIEGTMLKVKGVKKKDKKERKRKLESM